MGPGWGPSQHCSELRQLCHQGHTWSLPFHGNDGLQIQQHGRGIHSTAVYMQAWLVLNPKPRHSLPAGLRSVLCSDIGNSSNAIAG